MRCELTVAGAGYGDRQTHLWTLAASPPAVQGAMRIHAATWSVVGQGSFQRSQGTQTLNAQWTTNVQGMSAPIAFTVRASDGRLLVKAWHAQLRARGAVVGTQQLTIDGKPQRPGVIDGEAFEWSFPVLEDSATVASIAGSRSAPVAGSIGIMQPAGARATASCSWQLSRGTGS